jgi:hypothetical protein
MFAPFCSLRQARDSEMLFLFKLALLSISNNDNDAEKSGSVYFNLKRAHFMFRFPCSILAGRFWHTIQRGNKPYLLF